MCRDGVLFGSDGRWIAVRRCLLSLGFGQGGTFRGVRIRHQFLSDGMTKCNPPACMPRPAVDNLNPDFTILTCIAAQPMDPMTTEEPRAELPRVEADFLPSSQGRWSDVPPEQWNDWKWQLKNRVTSLEGLEKHLVLTSEERAGVILSGSKLALAVTPHYFNLIERENPGCPIRRQIIPHVGEGSVSAAEMADPCGEDSNMPVPGLVHRYPDRVLFLVTDRCASYCRYCTRSRVVSGAGEQELHTILRRR